MRAMWGGGDGARGLWTTKDTNFTKRDLVALVLNAVVLVVRSDVTNAARQYSARLQHPCTLRYDCRARSLLNLRPWGRRVGDEGVTRAQSTLLGRVGTSPSELPGRAPTATTTRWKMIGGAIRDNS